MARTAKAEAQAIRREAFVDAAWRLIATKGYEQMSVQDVLDELDASKGAFYHYFDSKRALLVAVVERMADAALAEQGPVLEDPSLNAVQKLDALFSGIAGWKAERKDLVMRTIDTWASDDNAIVREKIRRLTVDRLEPLLATIIAQGMEEGAFTVDSPHDTARVILSLIQGFQQQAIDLFFARRANTIAFEDVLRANAANLRALERMLGLQPGSVKGLGEDALRIWFG